MRNASRDAGCLAIVAILCGCANALAAAPSSPPARICGDTALLSGPATPPAGAVTVPAGDNSGLAPVANTTYWFAPGKHTLGTGEYDQIAPADNDVFVGAPGAILDGRTRNDYAFTQHARNVTIEYLTIENFGATGGNGGQGVVNHDSGNGWTIQYNTVRDNAGAGVFIGKNGVARYNCLKDNGEYGFQAYGPNGDANVVLTHNEIVGNNTYNWEKHDPGCGCSGGGKFWDTDKATVTDNWVHGNHGPGLWADTDNNDFDFENNYIADNDGEGIMYEISYNALIRNNTFSRNAIVEGPTNPGFPTGAIYLSESGGDSRVAARYASIEITGNRFVDNWSGVVLWENADRFCNSPANSSSGYCTLVAPSVANFTTCVKGTIKNEPYYSDCRWKTQNVSVHNNIFEFNPADIAGCSPYVACGLQGLFSQYGTYPNWSPYKRKVIENAITFHQNNLFADNTYEGPWEFMAHDQTRLLHKRAWRAAPYNQDAGSTFQPSSSQRWTPQP
jgi:Right handed beta helix region